MSTDPSTEEDGTYLDDMRDVLAAQAALSMDHLNRDRCLLRRDMRMSQNEQYGLNNDDEQDTGGTCEDDPLELKISRGNRVIHNHYEAPPDPQPQPQPQPLPVVRVPWWLIVLVILPIIILAALLVGWWVVGPGNPRPNPVGWELGIDVENPEDPLELRRRNANESGNTGVEPVNEPRSGGATGEGR